jgi:membrane protein DedA with SNARE-associated domain
MGGWQLGYDRLIRLRRKAPQIIAVALIVALCLYVSFELLEDIFVEGRSITSGPLISTLMNFTHNVKETIEYWGYTGIFSLMVLEASSLPIPSEVILPFVGYLISQPNSNFNFWLTVFVATAAALVGSLIDYYIGLKGVEILTKRRVLGRVLLSTDQLTVAARWFQKYGVAAIFLARLVPGLRTIISFPAGAAKMPIVKFLAYTTVGCVVWNALLIYVGYYLGTNWTEVAGVSHYILIGVIVAFVGSVVVYLVYRRRRKSTLDAGSSTNVV